MAEDIPVEMQEAALPARLGQVLGDALDQAAARVRGDQLDAGEPAIDQVTGERRPAGLVLFGAFADAEDLAITSCVSIGAQS